MQEAFRLMTRRTVSGTRAAFVIGDTSTTSASGIRLTIPNIKFAIETLQCFGWRLDHQFQIGVTTEDRAHSKNSIRENDIIILTRLRDS